MTKFEEFMKALVEAGFEENNHTLYCIFDGDETPEHSTLDWSAPREKFKEVCKKLDFEVVDGEGGTEGGGEYCYGVIRLGDTYYKAEWAYYSYDGSEYDYIKDTIRKVTPMEKTITVYV